MILSTFHVDGKMLGAVNCFCGNAMYSVCGNRKLGECPSSMNAKCAYGGHSEGDK